MSRSIYPYQAPDVSALARLLKRELDNREDKPGHVELLNILSKAAGYRNYQHFRASQKAEARMLSPAMAPEAVDYTQVDRATRCFDEADVLLYWPSRRSIQILCLWKLWSLLPSAEEMSEKQVNAFLKAHNGFGDHALLRRELCDARLLSRTRNGSRYFRIEKHPPPEALVLIRSQKAEGMTGEPAHDAAHE
ncbi:MAG: DUF2087 domain-containing protein [Rhodobacterales bacterium]|nr:DUF2087 domain-containing protein [Rhodobacterales bacterium]